ncbi:hypothetical protein [Brevibacillus sp. 179-C9.3 HS]|uniref:hypothetical protein n=1 Tax=unclassified Brevibacillus TaxID=2684853 RepID=UPI0039A24C33
MACENQRVDKYVPPFLAFSNDRTGREENAFLFWARYQNRRVCDDPTFHLPMVWIYGGKRAARGKRGEFISLRVLQHGRGRKPVRDSLKVLPNQLTIRKERILLTLALEFLRI